VAANPELPEIRRFITRYVHSVEQLEILCLMSSNPTKSWSISEVFHAIQSSETSVAACLRKFQHEGFLASKEDGIFCFSPATLAMAEMVRLLSVAYRERRVMIIEMIYKRPPDPVEDFSEAFRFRKDK
jgi:hypothetical protein